MTQYEQTRPVTLDYGTDERAVFNFFNAVYAYMCVGLAVTGGVAYFVATRVGLIEQLYSSGAYLVILLASFAAVYGINYAAPRVNPNVGLGLFLLYSALIGVVLSGLFIVYELGSIGHVFLLTAGTFAGMSVYGYVTKRDLSGIGSILIMAFWGLLLATVVNLFVANAALDWIITYAGILIFVGLTASQTQHLKELAHSVRNDAVMAPRLAVLGALALYLTFVNLFTFLLRAFGNRN